MSPSIQTHLIYLEGKAAVTLYIDGNKALLSETSVSVIGTRSPSPEGLDLAQQIGHACARAGLVLMSGLARGIDSTAMCAALDAKGSLIGVIGTPLNHAYPPENAGLQNTVARDHLLISPFPMTAKIDPKNFVFRNRVMAHMSKATVIVEAQARSGTRAQLGACIRENRPCFIHQATVDAVWWAQDAVRMGDAAPFQDVASLLRQLMRADII